MASMKYIVIELQTWDTGAMSTPAWAYDNRNSAEAKFHSVLAAAAVSNLPMHAACLLQNDGRLLNCASYDHAPEPEPEEAEVSDGE